MNKIQQIQYAIWQVKQNGQSIGGIGTQIAKLGKKTADECAPAIASAWEGTNREYYLRKMAGVAAKTAALGIKVVMLGKQVENSANSIMNAEQIAISVILNGSEG